MRIVFNLRDQDWQTTKSLGILHVSTRILAGLAELPGIERIDILANRSLVPRLAALKSSGVCRLHHLKASTPRRFMRLIWDHIGLVRACNRLAPDWLLLPKGFSPLLRWPRCHVSAYVHDNVFGYYERSGQRPYPRGEATVFRSMLRRTAERADTIVTNSQFTALEFSRDFSPRRKPIRIGAPIERVASAASEPTDGSLLLPTSSWPHKLTAQAVAWVARWMDTTRYCGKVHGFGTLPDGCWPARDQWIHHGRVPDRALAELESRAAVLIYFSAYEGYGLPPVEAAFAGRRAIASDLPALRETMPATALFSNTDYASFERALTHVLASPSQAPLIAENSRDVAARWMAELRRQAPPTH